MTDSKPAMWFWVAAVILLLWNLMGLMAFGYDGMMSAEALAALPDDQQALYAARPAWVVFGFAVAVFAGTAGAIALLMRRGIAGPLFIASLVGVLVQNSWFLVDDVLGVMGPSAVVMPLLIIGSLVGGILLVRNASSRGWLR